MIGQKHAACKVGATTAHALGQLVQNIKHLLEDNEPLKVR